MVDQSRRPWVVAGAAVATALVVGCGGAGEEMVMSSTAGPEAPTTIATVTIAASPAPSSTSSTPAAPAADVLEGVIVATGQAMAEPYQWWGVVDLSDGATIESSSRVLVEVPNGDIGCGHEFHRMFAHQLDAGEAVSFEVVAGEPGPRPEFWMTPSGETFDAAPAVRGERLRAVCPEGTDCCRRAVGDAAGDVGRAWPGCVRVLDDVAHLQRHLR